MDRIINMDTVFSKLKSTVTSTVSQLSSVLPGNPVTREYEVTAHLGSAGPGNLWKIYSGIKKTTKEPASIFVLEKKLLDSYNKKDKEFYLELLKKGISQLTRLKHPQVLTVQHSLEESRDSLAFATEPVLCSLSNVLGNLKNLPSPPPLHLKDLTLYEIEIKYGLLQLSEGLDFLHSGARIIHRNICPEAIIVNQSGAWKLFGFDFCLQKAADSSGSGSWAFQEYELSFHPDFQPNLNYLAPEYALTLHIDTSSDMFSLGSLAYAVFNGGKSLFNCYGDWPLFKRNCCELMNLTSQKMSCVPNPMKEHIKLLFNKAPEVRPDAQQFGKVDWFDDLVVKTLSYMDSMFQWDNLQKSQFYKGLPQILQQIPHRVALHRVVPSLFKEFLNPAMIPFVLPPIFEVVRNSSKEEFVQNIFPQLKDAMKLTDPPQISLIMIQNMELMLSKTPEEDIKAHIFPMLYNCLESNSQQIQELGLAVIPNCASLIDYNSMKNSLLPRIKKLCLGTSYLSTRVNSLVCIGKLLDYLDKWLVLDDVLPLLPSIPSKEPAVIMGILGIIKIAMDHKKIGITKDIMATKVLPFLIPLCIENNLAIHQFQALMSVIKELVERVETEQTTKLMQLNTGSQDQKNVASVSSGFNGVTTSDIFQSLGLGSFFKKQNSSELRSPEQQTPSQNNPVTMSNLSLEEKRRIAREQEMQQSVISNSPLTPIKVSPAKSPNSPRPIDLTSSLINSNIVQMSHTATLNTNQINTENSRMPYTFPSCNAPFGGQSYDHNSTSSWSLPNGSIGNMALTPTNYRSPQLQPVIAKPFSNSTMPCLPRPLVPQTQSKISQPFGDPMSIAAQFNPSTNSSVRPLTTSDINDLLS